MDGRGSGDRAGQGCPGLFLDFDGTLADTLGGVRQVYRDVVRAAGGHPTDAEFNELNGLSLRQMLAALQERHAIIGDSGRFLISYVERLQVVSRAHAPAEGAGEVLELARSLGYRVWVVTAAQRSFVVPWLQRNALAPLVDGVVGAEDVSRGKPDPQPYLRALERGGCDPRRSVALEDTTHGALSAARAGLGTWMVGPRTPGQDLLQHPFFSGQLTVFSELRGVLEAAEIIG